MGNRTEAPESWVFSTLSPCSTRHDCPPSATHPDPRLPAPDALPAADLRPGPSLHLSLRVHSHLTARPQALKAQVAPRLGMASPVRPGRDPWGHACRSAPRRLPLRLCRARSVLHTLPPQPSPEFQGGATETAG